MERDRSAHERTVAPDRVDASRRPPAYPAMPSTVIPEAPASAAVCATRRSRLSRAPRENGHKNAADLRIQAHFVVSLAVKPPASWHLVVRPSPSYEPRDPAGNALCQMDGDPREVSTRRRTTRGDRNMWRLDAAPIT